jgi:hypothetical protein
LAATIKVLLHTPYIIVTGEDMPPVSLVRFVRTSQPFSHLTDARQQYEKAITTMDQHGRIGKFLLTDLRQAVGRSDPGWEALIAELRPRMCKGFRRQGVLTKTAQGTLTVSRHARQDGQDILISDSEEQLLSFFRIAARMSR